MPGEAVESWNGQTSLYGLKASGRDTAASLWTKDSTSTGFSEEEGASGSLSPANLAQHPAHRVVEPVRHPLLEGDDGVVGDVDVLRADLRAALGDVAEADPRQLADELCPVGGVQGGHLQLRQPHEPAGAAEHLLVLRVVADDVTDILAEEALDALAELLPAVDIDLHDAVAAAGPIGRSRLEGGYLLRDLEVEGDV